MTGIKTLSFYSAAAILGIETSLQNGRELKAAAELAVKDIIRNSTPTEIKCTPEQAQLISSYLESVNIGVAGKDNMRIAAGDLVKPFYQSGLAKNANDVLRIMGEIYSKVPPVVQPEPKPEVTKARAKKAANPKVLAESVR